LDALAHRRSLPSGTLAAAEWFARIGGRPTVERLVDGLYNRIEADPALRRLFGRHLENERAGQKRFFTEWLGGPAVYSHSAYVPLKHRHDLFPITRALANQWLAHLHAALEQVVSEPEARSAIFAGAREFAMALVNDGDPPAPIRAQSHGSCLRYAPAIDALSVARRGDAAALGALLRSAPDILAAPTHAANLLNIATINGRTDVVSLLLDSGVNVNLPSPVGESLVMVTPLCAARLRRRKEIERLLLARGACEDVFTDAFLGDVARLDTGLAQVLDPAVEPLAITPVHHAVAGGQLEALRLLLSAVSGPLVNGARALRAAAAGANVAMVRLLLEHGADATSMGAGRWVQHPELAPLLSSAGAAVDRSGAWIGMACTGNQGRKDDPEYVEALLRYGARVDDRRLVGQSNDGGRATALHYAAKAGFVKTIAVLLDHGADPNARDDNGLTAADWLDRSAKSVDRQAVRRLLGSTAT
jgi:truncated hemoglobin YjbI/ankyrin repeat protein